MNTNTNDQQNLTNDQKPKVTYYNALQARNGHHQTCSSSSELSDSRGDYGVPTLEKTLRRGIEANKHIGNEIIELCEVIRENGFRLEKPESVGISFKKLFDIYNKISNKLVGLLLRARKHGLVEFPGEMLFQGRDDDVLIKFLKLDV